MPSHIFRCPLCDSDAATESVANVGAYLLCRCRCCSFVWSEDKASGIHAAAEYASYGDEYLGNQALENLKYWIKYKCFREKEFSCIHLAHPDGKPRLLDVGAGTGRFVAYCKTKGINAVGVEPSSVLRDYAKSNFGLHLFPTLDAIAELHESIPFDVVTSHDVIEHLSAFELGEHLAKIRSLLREGGYFLGNTPNYSSLNIAANPDRDPVISPPHHCLYFTPSTLDRCLKKHGFSEMETSTSGLSAMVLPKSMEAPISKLFVLAQKAVFGLFWPLVRRRYPDRGYQIFFCCKKAATKQTA